MKNISDLRSPLKCYLQNDMKDKLIIITHSESYVRLSVLYCLNASPLIIKTVQEWNNSNIYLFKTADVLHIPISIEMGQFDP